MNSLGAGHAASAIRGLLELAPGLDVVPRNGALRCIGASGVGDGAL